MQIRPSTGKLNKLGDITDLRTNVYGGAQLMRNYLDAYKSPEAALLAYHQGPGVAESYIKSKGDLKAVGPKGLDYVIDIGNNGGFGEPTKAEGDAESPKEPSRYEAYQSEATKLKKEQEARDEEARRNPPPPQPKTLLDRAIESANEIDPEKAALVGAGVNAILPMFTNPQVSPKVDTSKAVEANLSAQDKLDLARRNFQESAPQGMFSLEETYRQNQDELERIKNEQRLAQQQQKELSKAPPTMEAPPSSLVSEAPSRTKVGASGASNWVRAMGEDVPDVLADQAANMRKDNPKGGQAIIDRDMAARQRQEALGLGDYGLVRTEGGVQLALPPTTVAERQADIDKQNEANQAELEKRTEQARIQQAAQAQQLEQQRLANEADLERLRQERVAAGKQQNVLASQTKTAAPLQRALTTAETNAEIAQRKLARAQDQPNIAGRVLERTGIASTGTPKIGALPRAVVGAGAGYLGVMSYQEALKRFKAGDTSEGVLKALQAGSAALAVLPPAGKGLTKLKGLGALGAVGSYGYERARKYLKDDPSEE
jgi:TolA-binding protein